MHHMGKRNAVRTRSGKSVDHSDPALRVEPTLPPTSGRKPEACPSSQPKSGRECEGRALALSGGAADAPFFNQIQTNRNYQNRSKHCGRWTTAGFAEKKNLVSFHRLNCKTWDCGFCGPRKAKRYKYAISSTAEALKLNKFLTLTLDPKKIEGPPVAYLNKTFAKFRVYLQRAGYKISYIRVLEFQQNGNPHFHFVIDKNIPFEWIQKAWQEVGGGMFVNIKYVDTHRISRYLSKYLTKELLLSAPKGTRRVTTSRNIRIFPKKDTGQTWKLLKAHIGYLYGKVQEHIIQTEADEEGFLSFFSVPNGFETVPG
jgi:hypothetical protein